MGVFCWVEGVVGKVIFLSKDPLLLAKGHESQFLSGGGPVKRLFAE
jgi:hypothetical protein